MELRVETDSEDGQVLVVYLEIAKGKVKRTVEVAEGECYVDEDASGRLLGVEMLRPGRLQLLADDVSSRYKAPIVSQTVSRMKDVFAPA